MAGDSDMTIVSINEHVPMVRHAPHRFYILELALKDLWAFERDPWGVLRTFEGFEDVDDDTNLHVVGLNGDKGDLPTEYVKKTHAFILDFRPLGIEVVYWKCRLPDMLASAQEAQPKEVA